MSDDIAIHIENLSKKYYIGNNNGSLRGTLSSLFKKNKKEEFWALKDINLTIKKGESVGIIGRNGAGKSTLLKILSKITPPTQGRVVLNGRIASLLEVGTGFHPELTGRENIFLNGSLLGMSKIEINNQLDEIVQFSGISKFIDTPVKHCSSGMYVRLAFSVAAHLNTEILLVDEVLAVGDAEFQKKCLGKMDNYSKTNKTIIFVSHNIDLINKLCSRKIVLKNGAISPNNTFIDIHNSKKYYSDSPLKSVAVSQVGSKIVLKAEYYWKDKLLIPNLGFECTTVHGAYVFSYNPLIEGGKYLERDYPSSGIIAYEITSPLLQDGRYNFSIFFGDGHEDVLVDREGIQLTVMNMANFKNPSATVLPKISMIVE